MHERTETLRLPEEATRLVVLGDPHGDLIGLELALERESGPETVILSAGDNVGYADAVLSSYLCQLLEERGIRSVAGNHEAWSEGGQLFMGQPGRPRQLTDAARAWCEALPLRIRLESPRIPGGRATLVHSLPEFAYVNADKAGRLCDVEETSIVFCGHTHRPSIYTVPTGRKRAKVQRLHPRKASLEVAWAPGQRYVVDAGSLARPTGPGRRGPMRCDERATYAVFDLEEKVFSLVSLDKGPRIQALIEASMRR